MKVDALFISDVHLGSKGCNADLLLETLKIYEPKELIIVGDFIDGWLLKKRHFWTQDFTNVVRKILSYTKKGIKVTYVTGNHDDFLRQYIPLYLGENIEVTNEGVQLGSFNITGGGSLLQMGTNSFAYGSSGVGHSIFTEINQTGIYTSLSNVDFVIQDISETPLMSINDDGIFAQKRRLF